MFNATFNNISVISWLSVLLVEKTGVLGEKTTEYNSVLVEIELQNVQSFLKMGPEPLIALIFIDEYPTAIQSWLPQSL